VGPIFLSQSFYPIGRILFGDGASGIGHIGGPPLKSFER
jgi:hypothetical protein